MTLDDRSREWLARRLAEDEEYDGWPSEGFLKFLSDATLDLLRGRRRFNPSTLVFLFQYWERTGQKDKIFSAYSREQIESAIMKACTDEFTGLFPDWEKDVQRAIRLNTNIADQADRKQAQAAEDYGRIRSIYAQLIQESPELAKKGSRKARNALISKKMGKANSPAQIKQIQRALRGMK
jgi:hypothetical protein